MRSEDRGVGPREDDVNGTIYVSKTQTTVIRQEGFDDYADIYNTSDQSGYI